MGFDFDSGETLSATGRWLKGLVGRRRRRVETYAGRRVHIELRSLDAESFEDFAEELSRSLDRFDGVEGYHINGLFDRAVIAYRSPVTTPAQLVEVVEGVEAHCGIDGAALPERFAEFPGSSDRSVRQWTEFVADILAVALGVGLQIVEREPTEAEYDLAAFFSFLQDSPRLRRRMEEMAGPDLFEFLLEGLNTFIQAIGSGPVGPMVGMIHQVALRRGVDAQRAAWKRRESEMAPTGEGRVSRPVPRSERPSDIPNGIVEGYSDEAWFASIGGFLVALTDTQALEPSTAPLFSGLPKAARYGREGFVAEMLRALAERDSLVLNPGRLHLLDRIDTVLVDEAMAAANPGAAELIVEIAHRIGLTVAVTEADCDLDVDFDARALDPLGPPVEQIRHLQGFGACVLAVGRFEPEAMRCADISVGVADGRETFPWAADVIAGGIEDALFMVESLEYASRTAEQSVKLAGVGASLATLVSLRGVEETNPDSVKLAVHAASVVSLGNGISKVVDFERQPRPLPPDPTPWHALSRREVVGRLETDKQGLGARQVAERREPTPPEAPSRWTLVRRAIGEELANPMTPLLGAAAAASAVVGSLTDAALVGSVVTINAAVGGFERYRSERAMLALAERQRPEVRVRREGRTDQLDSDELVRGDIVAFESGDVVPVDCRILEATDLEVDESALTGESTPVRKSGGAVEADRVQQRSSMLYAGTSITGGETTAVVVATGAETEAQRHPGLMRPSRQRTGVEQRLEELTDLSIPIAGVGGAFITAMGLIRGEDLHSLVDVGIGLSVAAVPEGLPLLATAAQLASARRMSEHSIVVRNPRAIEALGRVDVLCADKTGTLTEGRIRLAVVSDGDRTVDLDDLGEAEMPEWVESAIGWALRASPSESSDERLPHATDRAVVEGGNRYSVEVTAPGGGWQRVDELRFQPRRGYHGVLGVSDDQHRIAVKGAPETILEICTHDARGDERHSLDDADRRALVDEAEELAAQGLRILCLADRPTEARESLEESDIRELAFRGFVGLRDPARATSATAVERLEKAGIRTLMITGDHPKTALGIAEEVGLPHQNGVLSGREIEAMSDEELEEVLPETSIIARVTPTQKGRIVEALQNAGGTVAMAGDGANDAAAIRLAEVGLAVGPEATTAARDAADLVLLDENIETMVRMVAEGRTMLESVRDAVAILAGGNFGEIGFSIAGSTVGTRAPLNARQLLLVNLLTDIAPSMAIALRHPKAEYLDELLRQDPADMLRGQLDRALAIRAGATAGGAGLAWSTCCLLPSDERGDSTTALLALVGSQLGQTIFLGNPARETVWAGLGSAAVLLGTVMTPGLSQLFGCRPVGPIGLGVAAGSSAVATGAAAFAERF